MCREFCQYPLVVRELGLIGRQSGNHPLATHQMQTSPSPLVWLMWTFAAMAATIFTDSPSPGTAASASSSWTGYVTAGQGRPLDYHRGSDQLTINGVDFPFAKGRVFLVAMSRGAVSVTQLDVPITDASYKVEFARIAGSGEVKTFLGE